MTVEVRNRQRRKVNRRQLQRLAELCCTGVSPVGVRKWQQAGRLFSDLSIVLVGDREMAKLNEQFHHTPGPTDVLSFDYGDGEGEIIVSVDHAFTQARRYLTTPARELALYVVHGILHLQGYDDHTPAQRRRMRAAERRLLAKVLPARIRR
jgi:probable rRNA maturation factor